MPPKKRQPRSSTTDEYIAFLKGLTLAGLGLESVSTNLHRVLLTDVNDGEAQISTDIKSSYEIAFEAEESFIVAAGYQIRQIIENAESEDKEFLTIECLFTALFKCDCAPSAKSRERFRDNEVRTIFWPYLRSLVSDLSHRMAVPAILLPLLLAVDTPEPLRSQS